MSIVTYDPFRNVRVLQNEINRMFERDMTDTGGMLAEWLFPADIKEDADRIVIKADLPGMTENEIHVNVDAGRLTISGERVFEKNEKPEDYHRVERKYGKFSRTFQLPGSTDVEHISASFKNGILDVTLPKAERAKPRAIAVAVDGGEETEPS